MGRLSKIVLRKVTGSSALIPIMVGMFCWNLLRNGLNAVILSAIGAKGVPKRALTVKSIRNGSVENDTAFQGLLRIMANVQVMKTKCF